MRIIRVRGKEDLTFLMRQLEVDAYGIRLMLPKALTYLIRISSLSCIQANILKQEMLSLGADAAIARGALTGKIKKTGCLLIGNLCQYNRLLEKLRKQPFGLSRLAKDLSWIIANYQKDEFKLDLGRFKLDLGPGRTRIMGIINLTPDSFSGDGFYASRAGNVVEYAQKMVQDGADIIDLGGESTRPGARPVAARDELARIIPVLKQLAKKIKVPISIDTYKPFVAQAALDNGACIINDITGLKNPAMGRIVSEYKSGVVIMHSKAKARYGSLLDEIIESLKFAAARAEEAGIAKDKIIIDPGIGFGKLTGHNLEIIRNLRELKILGKPVLLGPSRKSFIGKILKQSRTQERLSGTICACVFAASQGANILRVHDVKEVKNALRLNDAILGS